MNSTHQKVKLAVAALGVAAGLTALCVRAAGDQGIVEAEKPAALTVHIDGHGGGSIARKLNEMHAQMARDGWQFADMEPHIENGDTEGVWITYTKP
ncbi:MAG: hypothetical protein WD793_07815 [Steroidobacteraceae bacterium]